LEVTERGIFNLGFLVRDVHALYQDLSSQGFRFLSSPVHYAPFGNPVNEVILIGPDDIPIVNLERPLLTGESYKTNYFKLNHSLLISGALEDCRKFYGGLLQLQAVRDTVLAKGAVDDILALPTGTGSAVTSFNNRDMDHLSLLCMQLSLPGQAKALRPPAVGLFQLSFQVDVLNDFTHDAMGAGYKKISGPIEYASYYGLRRAVLFDGPDHVLIEIFTSMK
jgi:catechol 2,3-dioxygenase-like lactoylglutathione lyase family enzyme